jgi:26S proteasome regulatory subunit N2
MNIPSSPKEEGEEGKETEKGAAEVQKKKAEREKVGYELDNLIGLLVQNDDNTASGLQFC